MAEEDDGKEGLEQELSELYAFIHKKGLQKQLELWRKGADHEDDLKEYEKYAEEQAERIDSASMKIGED